MGRIIGRGCRMMGFNSFSIQAFLTIPDTTIVTKLSSIKIVGNYLPVGERKIKNFPLQNQCDK